MLAGPTARYPAPTQWPRRAADSERLVVSASSSGASDVAGCVDEMVLVEWETEYARLLLAMTQAQRSLSGVAERCDHVLGEAEEPKT